MAITYNNSSIDTPVLLLMYNRPDLALNVFESIKKAKPSKLYFAIDGPKNDIDIELVNQCKDIIKMVDWECEVKTLFRTKNLGCKKAVSEAITWFFEHEDKGIILEDDCLPDPTFFNYCDELLKYYEDDLSVGHISGSNFVDIYNPAESYYFSNYSYVWGWATWRRAWKLYSSNIEEIQPLLTNKLPVQNHLSIRENIYWKERILKTYFNKIDTWDYQWLYCMWKYNLKSIVPTQNMISNIGFDERATHTFRLIDGLSNKTRLGIKFILHPQNGKINFTLDRKSFSNIFKQNIILQFYLAYKKLVYIWISKLKIYIQEQQKAPKHHWAFRIFM